MVPRSAATPRSRAARPPPRARTARRSRTSRPPCATATGSPTPTWPASSTSTPGSSTTRAGSPRRCTAASGRCASAGAAAPTATHRAATGGMRSRRRSCGCRGTASWWATPTAPTRRPRRPSRCCDRPPEGSPSARAFAATYLGAIRALTGDPGPDRPTSSTAYPLLRRARELATAAGRADLVALAATTRASPDPTSTTTPASRCSATACAPGWSTASTRSPPAPTPTWPSSATACHRLDELERCVADGLAFTRERGFSSHAHNLAVHGGLLALRRGRWTAAEAALRPGGAVSRARDAQRRWAVRQAAGPPVGGHRPRPTEALLVGAWDTPLRRRTVTELALAGTALVEWAWLADRRDRVEAVSRAWRPHAARPTAEPAWAEVLRYAGGEASPVGRSPEVPVPGRPGCAATGGPPPRAGPASATRTSGRWSWPSRARSGRP